MEASPTIHSHVLHSQPKEIIYSVNKYFLKQKENRGPLKVGEKGLLFIIAGGGEVATLQTVIHLRWPHLKRLHILERLVYVL